MAESLEKAGAVSGHLADDLISKISQHRCPASQQGAVHIPKEEYLRYIWLQQVCQQLQMAL
jgi:hypothetical protein